MRGLLRGAALLLLLLPLMRIQGVHAQSAEPVADSAGAAPPARWTLFVDGRAHQEGAFVSEPAPPVDSLPSVARAAVAQLQRAGHYLAQIDSVRVGGNTPPEVQLFATSGPVFEVGRVRIEGAAALDSLRLRALMDTRPGRILDARRLETDVEAILSRYEAAGYPLAQVRIVELAMQPGDPPSLDVLLQVEEGRQLRLARVEVLGGQRTKAPYVARVAGLEPGRELRDYDPAEVRARLEATGFFREVGDPVLLVEPAGDAVLQIPVEEAPPGSFDLVLGYLPDAGAGGGGSFVGNGHLVLQNLFGGGRLLSLRLNRLPGQVSSVDVRAADPYLFGLPFSVEGRFEGLQQDSTYGKQRYRMEVGYRFTGGLLAFLTLSREATRPGQAGIRLGADGQQRIPRANALFAGLGVRYQRLDRIVNPRRGLYVETNLEQGRKSRSALVRTAEGDTTSERTRLRQERLQGTGRVYVPAFARQVLVLGGDAGVLLSDAYDPSDLFHFGGAMSLRGYNEDQFLGRFVARALAEYRYQIDRTSYAFVFFDLGYVDTPAMGDAPSRQGFHPGYGLGIQFSTAVGLVNASYALNPDDDPSAGKVHFGLSFGL